MKKNRYYTGKHLTAESFSSEQEYQCGKLMELSRLIIGKAALSGLNVSRFCDDTIVVSAGAAFDGNGRILRQPSEAVLPVRTLPGFYPRRTLTLYIYHSEREDGEYIIETPSFSFCEEAGALALADIVFEFETINKVQNRPRALNSAFSSLLSFDQRGIEEIRKELYHLSQSVNAHFRVMEDRLARDALRHGTAVIRADRQKLLTTGMIPYPAGISPSYIDFTAAEGGNEVLMGDAALFPPPDPSKNHLEVLRKAVKLFPQERRFQLAVELRNPVEGREINLRWIMAGEEQRVYADQDY